MPKPTRQVHRLNDLDGKTWTRYSISIWDLTKSTDEAQLRHPALFPVSLISRLLEIYTKPGDVVLDPFMGAGSTLLAAVNLKRKAIGFDISPQYVTLAQNRLREGGYSESSTDQVQLYQEDARLLDQFVQPESVDFVVTSPPYWDIHNQRRTADRKSPRPYSRASNDLGNISDYHQFLGELGTVLSQLHSAIKAGRWCVLIVMDLRKGRNFYPFHIDCIEKMQEVNFLLEDIIIWDRRRDYHNLRPLGYPTIFRVNKVHEYLLIFQKPK
jgi:DNA modification methylase